MAHRLVPVSIKVSETEDLQNGPDLQSPDSIPENVSCLFIDERPFSQAGRSRLGPFLSLFVLKPYSPTEYPVSNPAPFVPIGRRLWMQMELPAGRRVLPESTLSRHPIHNTNEYSHL